ncbi:MAG TPA: excinuclease ABC subunit UvrB [Spirochaetota bacterium]|nr:excinuclease ABC subunit UvrB [Spirochaetota bacterium]HOS33860.1 excinuclease ABC subunit UvrB [Spirochaetota bacterium]HOS56841.1 excinuclease ABC subunit UvrB [Spirochaetota bacterium]HPK62014.1 excinuclease ABC subunit UvrB [Spirochaetota bacterium]HQF79004.1 excinuclease ABC subunit UvrB [Spirochaetota bacterium]
MRKFEIASEFGPSGDQENAIKLLSENLASGMKGQTLLGVTGSGKTFTIAKVIEKIQKPTLVLSHNKTLAAQLYREFKDFFPNNAVEYFVSYYDYYQPEAYVASRDLYIEKDADINEEIDMMRLAATSALMSRDDVIIVATVSCIYGLGNPEDYKKLSVKIRKDGRLDRDDLIRRLVGIQYDREDAALERGKFRVRGDLVDIYPAYAKSGFRIGFFGDTVEGIYALDILNNKVIEELDKITIFPAKHFVTTRDTVLRTIPFIKEELDERVKFFTSQNKELEARRIQAKTEYDMDMLLEVGYCKGIENYSRFFAQRKRGERPSTLIDFFPEGFLTVIDESHATIPQIGGMYEGDKARKTSLVDYGFRLPSALDNRPLYFKEFESMIGQVIFVSATPREYEHINSQAIVEQIIRPTGLVDPSIDVRPTEGQMDDLFEEINAVVSRNERILITTLTKRMAEDLTDFLMEKGVKTRYLHSEIETIERVEILQGLRAGEFDVLVGINLLREGLDLPEVSLVAILDADKIGFLRSATSLIQTIGRAARNANGKVIMYADKMSIAMKEAIEETNRRREIQIDYNTKNGITPATIVKKVESILDRKKALEVKEEQGEIEDLQKRYNFFNKNDRTQYVKILEKNMLEAAKNLEFEKAAVLRDEILRVQKEFGK